MRTTKVSPLVAGLGTAYRGRQEAARDADHVAALDVKHQA